jgi:hypothetical protein
MRITRLPLLRYLAGAFLTMALPACSLPPAFTSAPAITRLVTGAPTPTVAGYQVTLTAGVLSTLTNPMIIRQSEFDTLTINVPVPVSAPVEPVPLASGHAPTQPAQCPPAGSPTILASQDLGPDVIRAYLDEGGTVADLGKLLNREYSIHNGYAKGYSSARLFHTDLTGDSTPDVLIVYQTGFRYYRPRVELLFFHCSNKRYDGGVVVASEGRVFARVFGKPDLGILSIQDTNDNGMPEIVFTYEGTMGAPPYTRYTHTLEWDGSQMVSLANPP